MEKPLVISENRQEIKREYGEICTNCDKKIIGEAFWGGIYEFCSSECRDIFLKKEVVNMKRYTANTVLATEFCMSNADIGDYRYQYGRTDRPIFAIGETYYCAVKIYQKPAKHQSITFEWVKKYSSFAESIGWQIWECKNK